MHALKTKYLPEYTYTDYAKWEGDWELIYGIPYSMSPSPDYGHQRTNKSLIKYLDDALGGCNKCESIFEFNWKMNENTVVKPDILVACEPFEKGSFLSKTPEIIFEILSPLTGGKDRTLKYELYENEGVKYYIIINHEEKSASLFVLKNKKYQPMIATGLFHFELSGCSFDYDFGKIW